MKKLVGEIMNDMYGPTFDFVQTSPCGSGINETLTRIETDPNLRLRVDMSLHDVRKIIPEIALKYFSTEVMRRGLTIHQNDALYLQAMGESFIDKFFDDFKDFSNKVKITDSLSSVLQKNKDIDHVIFEGAQGLMLDQNHKNFPFVTRSNTGVKNAMEMCADLSITDIEVIYVTRAYLTRHGAGPLPHEIHLIPWLEDDKTNIENEFQGKLRYSRLQPFSMCEEIMHDITPYRKNVKVSLAMTCMDQVPIHQYIDNHGFRVDFDPIDIPGLMNDLTNNLFHKFKFSYGPEATNRDDITIMK